MIYPFTLGRRSFFRCLHLFNGRGMVVALICVVAVTGEPGVLMQTIEEEGKQLLSKIEDMDANMEDHILQHPSQAK